jgi:hypothetical protein
MLRIWNRSPVLRRALLSLAAGVAGLWSAGPGTAQDSRSVDFQTWSLGQQTRPIFTQPQNQFGGAVTSGSHWTSPAPSPAPVEPSPADAMSPRAQPGAEPSHPAFGSGVDADPALNPSATAATTKPSERKRTVGPGRRRQAVDRRLAGTRPGGDAARDGRTGSVAAGRPGGAAEAQPLPSVLRLQD